MNVAIIGYGKMGKAIEEILQERGHSITLICDHTPKEEDLKNIDVAIEFSQPEVAFENVKTLVNAGISTISGTTGWIDKLPKIHKLVSEKNTGFLYASNYSLGVNIFFELNTRLAKIMAKYKEYEVSIEEIHHTQKLDAPSGTAISLANDIIANSEMTNWKLDEKDSDDTIPIFAEREENVPGTHIVAYDSEIDSIEIAHTAHSRKGFALGAVLAAEFINGKKGVFSMKDVLGLD